MTTSTNLALTSEEALNHACALVEQAERECLVGDVSHLITEATAVLQGHARVITETDTIDATCIRDDVPTIVARGYQAMAANAIDQALSMIFELGRSDIAATLYKAIKALENARDARTICTGETLPCAIELDARDLSEAVAFAQNDMFSQEAAEVANFVPAELVPEDAQDVEGDEGFTSVSPDKLWVRLSETIIPDDAVEPLEEEDVLDCSEEIVEVRSVPAKSSETSVFLGLGLTVPPPPPMPTYTRMSAPPALPNRPYVDPNQLKLPFWATETTEDVRNDVVLMTFRKPGRTDHDELRANFHSAAN